MRIGTAPGKVADQLRMQLFDRPRTPLNLLDSFLKRGVNPSLCMSNFNGRSVIWALRPDLGNQSGLKTYYRPVNPS